MFYRLIESLPTYAKKIILAFGDMCIVICSYIIAGLFLENTGNFFNSSFFILVFIASVIHISVFHFSKTYNDIVRYSSVREYMIMSGCSMLSTLIMCIVSKFLDLNNVSIKTIILAGFIIAIGCVSYRVVIRTLLTYLMNYNKKKKQRLLIIGAGEATSQVINNIKTHLMGEYEIVGMIDDSHEKRNSRMHGIEVIGNRDDIIKITQEKNVDLILFAIQNIKSKDKNAILNICSKTNAQVKIMLPMEKIIWGKEITESFRDIQVEDLLGRDPIKLDNEEIGDCLTGKVILVTGAGGSIGSELCRQISEYNPKLLVMLDIYENTLYETELEIRRKVNGVNLVAVVGSVRDRKRMEDIFKKYSPEIVFHAAAHKHVPLMEVSPLEAIKNNVFGTYNTATCADKYKAEKFVLISTDKAVNPTNIMGATKRICEMIVQAKAQNSNTKFAAVRFGNVLGSHGSVIPIFKKQIEEGGPITITHKDITRYFMLIPEAVGLILQAMTFAESGEIFVLDMGQPVKIYDLAKTMVKLSGKIIPIKITGLRPGEKLYEELLISEEGLERTVNEKIMVSRIKEITEIELEQKLEKLRKLIATEDHSIDDIKELVKEIVPTYINVEKEGQPEKKKNVRKLQAV